MKLKTLLIGLVAAGALGAAGYGLYAIGMNRGMNLGMNIASAPASAGGSEAPAAAGPTQAVPQSIAQGEEATRRHIAAGIKAGEVDPATGKRILYYHDPMVPGNKFDKPAKSPFMDMMLVPVYGGDPADEGKVTVSPRIQQNLGVRTAQVAEGTLSPQVAAVGSIAWNERDQVIVQARATGFVERLHVRATLDRVAKGQPLAELYVPEWIAAQEEFLSVRRMQGTELAPLVDGARQRMRQVGMSEAQIALVDNSGRTQPRFMLVAPIGGVVTELMAREGMTVMSGATLFRINGTGAVWANAEVPESQAALLRVGAKVQASLAALSQAAASGQGNLLALSVAAMRARATVGEVSDALEQVFGRHRADIQKVTGVYAAAYDSAEGWEKLKAEITEFAQAEGRRPRVMIAKLGQDGHDRGAKVVATAFADLGFDVDIGPLFQTPAECARQAIENDVHAVGVSTLAAGHKTLVPAIIDELRTQGGGDIIVFVGGVIPQQDYGFLYGAGVKGIYGPGTPIPVSAKDVLEQIRAALGPSK